MNILLNHTNIHSHTAIREIPFQTTIREIFIPRKLEIIRCAHVVCGQGYTQQLHISLSVRQECSCVFLLESHCCCCCHHLVLGPERGRTLLHLTPPHSQHALPTHSCAKVFIASSHSTLPSHSPPYSCCSLATVDCGMHCAQVLIPEWRWSSNVVAPITS